MASHNTHDSDGELVSSSADSSLSDGHARTPAAVITKTGLHSQGMRVGTGSCTVRCAAPTFAHQIPKSGFGNDRKASPRISTNPETIQRASQPRIEGTTTHSMHAIRTVNPNRTPVRT